MVILIAKIGDIVMSFEIKGNGPPVTMISGLATDSSVWSLQVPSFSMNFMTVLPDNRGAGKTDAPNRPYTIEMMADDTSKLLDIIGIESSSLVGFGMGGRIAMEMAIRHPTQVKSVVVCSCAAKATPTESELLGSLKASIANGSARIDLAKEEIGWTLNPRFFEDKRVAEAVARVRMAKMSGTSDDAFVRQIDAILNYDAGPRLGGIRCPTLVVAGKNDRLVPSEFQWDLARGIPKAAFQALDSAHMVLSEAANDFNDSTLAFLVENNI